jgi:hypothetical protein
MHTAAVVVAPAIVGATEHTKGKRGIRSQWVVVPGQYAKTKVGHRRGADRIWSLDVFGRGGGI